MKLKPFLIVVAMSTLAIAGCGQKPVEEIKAATSAVEALVAEGAEKYAAEDVKLTEDELAAALAEIKAQDDKTFKNYDKAKDLLAKAKAKAETAKAELPAKKELAKSAAISALEAARTAVDEAKALLGKAPKGKGSKADIEAMKADVAGLEQSISEVQPLIDSEDYIAATEKSNPIKDKAAEVSAQITEAMQKVGKK